MVVDMAQRKRKYNNAIFYYHPEYEITLMPSLYSGQPGFIKFDSYLEFSVYNEIRKYGDKIIKDKVYQLSVCKIKPDFTIEGDETIVIEVKGFETKDWKIKWALFQREYPDIKKYVIKSSLDFLKISKIFN